MEHTRISATRSAAVYLVALATLSAAYPLVGGGLGSACQPRTIFCADGDGMSSRYFKCVNGALELAFCPNSSTCVGSKDTTIFCAADGNPVSYSDGASFEPTTTTTTLVVEFDSTTTLNTASTSVYSVKSTLAATPYNPPKSMTVSKTAAAPDAMPNSRHEQAELPNLFASQIFTSAWPSDLLQFARPHTPASQSPALQSSAVSASMSPKQTAMSTHIVQGLTSSVLSASAGTLTVVVSPLATPSSRSRFDAVRSTRSPWALNALSSTTLASATLSVLADSVPKIGGIEAPRVLSVIGNAILAQRTEMSDDDSDEAESLTVSAENTPVVASSTTTSQAPSRGIMPVRAPVMSCTPGSFVCEAHGTRPAYFACDSVGVALPASCAANEVCYQYGQSILCDAPGSNLLFQHARLAMF